MLSNLAALNTEGATYRELKASLRLDDGILYANLKVLEKMGYLATSKVKVDNKELDVFSITEQGRLEWQQVKAWLKNLTGE